jgi:5,10-methylenetetrahydrofolate reductase
MIQRNSGKEVVEFFPSAARTATDSTTQALRSAQGLFFINVTSVTATPSVVFTIYGTSPNGSTDYTILASAAVTATGLTVLRVSPHLTAAANTIAKDILPQAVKITAAHGDTDSITYSVHFVGMDS